MAGALAAVLLALAVVQRGSRTCVLAGHVERVSTLVALAAWTGGGAVRDA